MDLLPSDRPLCLEVEGTTRFVGFKLFSRSVQEESRSSDLEFETYSNYLLSLLQFPHVRIRDYRGKEGCRCPSSQYWMGLSQASGM
jgi:hypothetical protein